MKKKASNPMKLEFLKAGFNHAYKFKDGSGKWTPYLHFVKQSDNKLFFKPVDDTESTLDVEVISVFLTTVPDLLAGEYKIFNQCKFYGTWQKAPHVCGKDCPLGKAI
jgi:uncharacterized membrane protein